MPGTGTMTMQLVRVVWCGCTASGGGVGSGGYWVNSQKEYWRRCSPLMGLLGGSVISE